MVFEFAHHIDDDGACLRASHVWIEDSLASSSSKGLVRRVLPSAHCFVVVHALFFSTSTSTSSCATLVYLSLHGFLFFTATADERSPSPGHAPFK